MNVMPALPSGTSAFSLYAVALIVRALSDLGYRPDKDRASGRGQHAATEWRCDLGNGRAHLEP